MPKWLKKIFRSSNTPNLLDIQKRYPQYTFGNGTYGFPEIFDWSEGATLKMGAYCSIANGVKIFLGGEHRTDWVTTYPFMEFLPQAKNIKGHPATKGDVVIGNDVWIAAEAVILSGVTIGDGAVIGTHAVVSKNVAPYSVVVGNPAREVKKRFDEATIEKLLDMKWWDWEQSKIEKHLPLLLSNDIDAFIKEATR